MGLHGLSGRRAIFAGNVATLLKSLQEIGPQIEAKVELAKSEKAKTASGLGRILFAQSKGSTIFMVGLQIV